MPQASPDQPYRGSPTAAKVFRVFRNTTMASIEGLKLLLEECAGLRAELVTIHSLHSDGDGDSDGLFSARQQNRILELQKAAKQMDEVLASLPPEASDKQNVVINTDLH